jgi:hypothetical protein
MHERESGLGFSEEPPSEKKKEGSENSKEISGGIGVAEPDVKAEAQPEDRVEEQRAARLQELKREARQNYEKEVAPLLAELQSMALKFDDMDDETRKAITVQIQKAEKFFRLENFFHSRPGDGSVNELRQMKQNLERARNGVEFARSFWRQSADQVIFQQQWWGGVNLPDWQRALRREET